MKKLQMMLVYQEKYALHSWNTSLINVRGETNRVQSFSLTTRRGREMYQTIWAKDYGRRSGEAVEAMMWGRELHSCPVPPKIPFFRFDSRNLERQRAEEHLRQPQRERREMERELEEIKKKIRRLNKEEWKLEEKRRRAAGDRETGREKRKGLSRRSGWKCMRVSQEKRQELEAPPRAGETSAAVQAESSGGARESRRS
ncbi:hypothetical protein MHYP_G00274310 [Metynnis hypsauchen]